MPATGKLAGLSDQERKKNVDLKTHSIEYLFAFTGASSRLVGQNLKAFQQCNRWRTSWRYSPHDETQEKCLLFLEAVDTFNRFVNNSV